MLPRADHVWGSEPSLRTAETPVASTVPEPHGKPGGGLWGHPGLMAPPYIEHVAGHLMAEGHPESEAYHIAVGVVENWAAGHDGHGHAVHPDVQAAAAKNVAEWEALRAKYAGSGKRFNPFHAPAGPGGGQFTSGGGGGGASAKTAKGKTAAPAKKRPAPSGHLAAPSPPKAHGQHAHKEQLLARARADRAKAHQMEQQLQGLEKQLHAAVTASKKAAAAHKAAASGKTVTGKVASKAGHKKHHAHHARKAAHHTASLQLRITTLKVQIRDLLAQAAQLEAQAHQIRSMPDGCWG